MAAVAPKTPRLMDDVVRVLEEWENVRAAPEE